MWNKNILPWVTSSSPFKGKSISPLRRRMTRSEIYMFSEHKRWIYFNMSQSMSKLIRLSIWLFFNRQNQVIGELHSGVKLAAIKAIAKSKFWKQNWNFDKDCTCARILCEHSNLSLLQVTNKEFLLTSSIHFLWCREVMRRLKTSIRLSLILNSLKHNYKKSIRELYRVWGVKGNKTEWKSHMLRM